MSPSLSEAITELRRARSKLEALIEQVNVAQGSGSSHDVGRAWSEFERELLVQLELCERRVLPALARKSETEARGVVQELRYLRTRCDELDRAVSANQLKPGALRAFADEVLAHACRRERLADEEPDE